MIRSRHRLLASLAAVVALAFAAEASAASLLQLAYSSAKTFGSVHVAGGAIDLTSGAMIVTTSSFGFVPTGYFDGASVVQYPNERGSLGVAEYGVNAIHDAILEGANYAGGGFWNGTNGIISSSAANDPNTIHAIGFLDNSVTAYTSFGGIPVTTDQSIIAYTYFGDSLLQGIVTPDDYSLWLGSITNPAGANVSGITGGPVEWLDANYMQNGTVTPDDYSLWLGGITSPYMTPLNWNPTTGPIVPAAALSAVPEPASLVLVLAALPLAFLTVMRTKKRSR